MNNDSHRGPPDELPAASQTASGPSLLRALGPGAAVAIVVGNTIGSGIFLKPGLIAADGGHFGLIIGTWIFGGLLCLLGALSLAELAAMLPRAGGLYVYLREAFGRPTAFLFGWNEFMFGIPASIGALAVAFVGSMSKLTGWQPAEGMQVACALALIAGMAWVNYVGVIWGGRVQSATTLVKAAGVGLIALAPFVLYLASGASISASNYTSTLEGAVDAPGLTDGPSLATRFGLVLLAVMWAYNGWHGVAPVGEEIRDPERNIPKALFAGIALLALLYVSANVAYHGVLSMQEMAAAGDHAAEEMARKLLGPAGAATISLIVMCSTFGAINSNMLLGPRVSFAMGRDDVFFRQLGRVHANYRTPSVAILVQALMAASLVVVSAGCRSWAAGIDAATLPAGTLREIVVTLQRDSIFTLLTNFVIFAASIFYLLSVAAVLVLRRRHPEWPRPYRTWGYPLVPMLFVGVYLWFLWRIYSDQPFEAHAGLVLIALGLPAYYAWRTWAARKPE